MNSEKGPKREGEGRMTPKHWFIGASPHFSLRWLMSAHLHKSIFFYFLEGATLTVMALRLANKSW